MHNAYGLPLVLGVQILTRKPWRLTAYLTQRCGPALTLTSRTARVGCVTMMQCWRITVLT